MARGTRTLYPCEQNKGLSLTFQPLEEGRSGQRPNHCDKHSDKDEDNNPKNVNNVLYIKSSTDSSDSFHQNSSAWLDSIFP